MEIQSILMLIQAFTEHSLTELNVEEGGVKVCLKREAGALGAPVTLVAENGKAPVPAAVPPVAGIPAAGVVTAVPGAVPVAGAAASAGMAAQAAVVPAAAAVVPVIGTPAAVTSAPVAAVPVAGVTVPAAGIPSGMTASVPTAVSQTVPGAGAAQEAIDSDHVVVSPLVGVFYSAPSPEAESFVKVGDRVKKGQILGIIEAMKLMNEIESEFDGVVEAVLVKNEEVVEVGQPLFRIR